MGNTSNIEGVKIILRAQKLPGAVAVIDDLEHENNRLKQCILDLVEEPRRSTKLINSKVKDSEPMAATFLKGQVINAIFLTR